MMIGAMLWFSGTGADGSLAEQVAVISFYVFREIYVSLLSTSTGVSSPVPDSA